MLFQFLNKYICILKNNNNKNQFSLFNINSSKKKKIYTVLNYLLSEGQASVLIFAEREIE